jgi:DNA transformation protein
MPLSTSHPEISMAVSDSYKVYVLEQLQVVGTVTAKAMFGGVGLYQHGMFFGLIDDDTVYLKVDDSNRAEFERAGSRPFQPYGEGSYSMKYYELPADVLEDRSTLREWVLKAVAVARKSAIARKKPPRSS